MTVEAELPRVAQPVVPDLRQRAGLPREGIARRHRESGSAVDVDAQELAEPHAKVLRVVVRIAAATTVADADVQKAVRPERHVAAVVVGQRMRHREHLPPASRIGNVCIRGAAQELGHHDRAVGLARVVHVEPAVRAIARMKRKPEEPALASRQDLRGYVQERRGEYRAILDDLDDAGLLGDE